MSAQELIARTAMGDAGIFFHRVRDSLMDGIPVFSIMRDEKYFLPHFLAHYRSIGVRSFIIYADSCDDEFMAMLEAEQDVSVLLSKTLKFKDVMYTNRRGWPVKLGQFIKESVSNEFFHNLWHIVVDADEFLLLPPPMENINQYVSLLEARGRSYSFAPMVDFYPQKISHRNYHPSINPFVASPYFDSGRCHRVDHESRNIIVLNVGVRGRLLSHLKNHALAEIEQRGLRAADLQLPLNFKFPVMKSAGRTRRGGHHWVSQIDSIDLASCLAHFKFYPDLDKKLSSALEEKQYVNGSIEYEFLKLAVDRMQNVNLLTKHSVAYSSPLDLVKASILDCISV